MPPSKTFARINRQALSRKSVLLAIALIVVFVAIAIGVSVGRFTLRLQHFAANPSAGYHSDFYLYVSPGARRQASAGKKVTILVNPNNSGTTSDDLRVHQSDAWWTGFERRGIADHLQVVLLVPAFPRPATDWKIYTHALDRDALTTTREDLRRLDLQLIAMIEAAKTALAEEKIDCDDQILIQGFSASAMFANRFVALHPRMIKAAAVGSPGGWPLVPVETVGEDRLPYPIGTADWESLIGEPFDLNGFRQVPQLFYLGSNDDNDSVDFRDGWDEEHAEIVDRMFGRDPVSRWRRAKACYDSIGADARFELIPNAGHDRKSLQYLSTEFFEKFVSK